MDVTPLPYLSACPLTEQDRLNLRAAKDAVYDGLVQLKVAEPGDERVLAIGIDDEPWTGATFYHVEACWHTSLQTQLARMLTGDEEWDRLVLEVQFTLGGE